MSCSGTSGCQCGCCAGTSVQTPQPESNSPGLPSISRRVGTWAQFNESMLARLSSSDYPALKALTTRSDDDFTIALLDATSMMFDILTFYQERLANECYLRTAQQTRSLTELSRLIGYRPSPGVSASTYVAFTLTQAPGQPANPNAPAVTIPKGTQVQSVPVQGQTPQTFETFADIQAKADWTALPAQTGVPWVPGTTNGIYLSGTATQLQLGDSLLILGVERETWPSSGGSQTPSEQWEVVVLNQVQVDTVNNVTYVAWNQALPHISGGSPRAWTSAKVFAFRQKAALFGNNAPDPNLFALDGSNKITSLPNLITAGAGPWSWNNFFIGGTDPSSSVRFTWVDLNAKYPKIVVNSWFALTIGGSAQLYKVQVAGAVSLSFYGISAQVTQLVADFLDGSIKKFTLQGTDVSAQSEQLTIAEQPLTYPLYGNSVALEVLRNDLAGVQVIALSGNRQKIALTVAPGSVADFVPDDGTNQRPLDAGEILTLTTAVNLPVDTTGACEDWSSSSTAVTLYVEDASGRTGTISAAPSCFALSPSAASDPVVGEYAIVSQVDNSATNNTVFGLTASLNYCYARSTTTVNANVGLATAGQSVTEILGNGSASTPDQEFTLKQSPLTFILAATPTGCASTLEVQANGMDWTEVASLYQASPSATVYATLNQSDGTTDVLFGDGEEGATLPTGQNNIIANYRIGSGSAGNIGPGTLTTLIDRPLGVSGVTNPGPATGGQDPQSLVGIRQFAPQTVLTLGRAVSITDYQNFASTFSGIAKAYAIWIPSGAMQGVFLTVAGTNGAAVPQGSPPNGNPLAGALQAYGNPLIPITLQTYVETLFSVTASVQYDPAYQQPAVKAEVLQTLSDTFNFESRSFGQGVSYDEVATVIQNVPGVVAVNVTQLQRGDSSQGGDIGQAGAPSVSQWNIWLAAIMNPPLVRPYPDPPNGLCSYLPIASPTSPAQPAEILVLDPRPSGVTLGVMP